MTSKGKNNMVEIVKYSATGRRKTSIARVNITPGSGKINVNKVPFEQYFKREIHQIVILEPLRLTNSLKKFDLDVHANGGGLTGQAGAMRLALSRALVLCDQGLKSTLRKNSFLTRDPRAKERKKPGQKGARKRFQWVKR